ncbi:UBX domain containing protein [Carpediemonas membranifera]|uniref:UBX domain containing protein n=1 Tax=Carpediemonas membranifera TaxID=201153 RepID=A0A8J6B624_9EUKA|nr:UBX domain containing protein [Carpediemonas membranifera]|eukprot:KAG9393602.1 UBX domain containing protein [Carpediemonas membranifera]
MSETKEVLIDMGFDANDADTAIQNGYNDVESALEYIQAKMSGNTLPPRNVQAINNESSTSQQTGETFEERQARLKQQIEQRKQERLLKEKETEKLDEIRRRQDTRATRDAKEAWEAKQVAIDREARKNERRKERDYKAALLARIQADREAKLAAQPPMPAAPQSPAASAAPDSPVAQGSTPFSIARQSPAPPAEITETVVRVRQPDNQCIERVFSVKDTVRDVVRWVADARTDGCVGPFDLFIFPKRKFSGAALDMTLKEANAVPKVLFAMISHVQ